jgi:hypothetical protein
VLAAAQKLITPALEAFLSLPDSFDAADGLDATMVKCAVMVAAARGSPEPRGDGTLTTNMLAEFAVQGAAEEALVDKLLGDVPLMRDMLVAGGAAKGRYGEAMAIHTKLLEGSGTLRDAAAAAPPAGAPWDDRSPAGILKRLAVGVAVGLATPLEIRFASSLAGCNVTEKSPACYVDPVARYAHFAKYYARGDLDPAFPALTAFELSHTVDADSVDEDMVWLRSTMANFRPDNIAIDYHWRYAESVHTEVAYGDSHCNLFNNGTGGVCNGHFSDIPVGRDAIFMRPCLFCRKNHARNVQGA